MTQKDYAEGYVDGMKSAFIIIITSLTDNLKEIIERFPTEFDGENEKRNI